MKIVNDRMNYPSPRLNGDLIIASIPIINKITIIRYIVRNISIPIQIKYSIKDDPSRILNIYIFLLINRGMSFN